MFKAYIALLAVITIILVPRAWDLRLLYIDADVRNKVELVLRNEAEQNGWVLSDLSVASLTQTTARLCYHEHRTGEDPITCFDAAL